MTLKELKKYLNNLPKEMDGFNIMNGEVGIVPPKEDDLDDDEDDIFYRLDKPIIAIYVDEKTKEVCFFHQTQEDVNKFYGNSEGTE